MRAKAALLERHDDVAVLGEALEDLARGRGRVLAIEGPPGIGKTTLVTRAVQLAHDRGVQVFTARAAEMERDLAFGVVHQLFAQHVAACEEAARDTLLAGPAASAAGPLGLEGAAPAVDVFAVLHGLHWLVSNLAADQPLLAVVDDLQWVDGPSMRFLAYLSRRIPELPVALVAATRPPAPGPEGDALRAVLADPAVELLEPAPLSMAAAIAMVRERLDPYAEQEFARACHAATGGNPFLLDQVIASAARDGVPATAAGAARVDALGPRAVARAVLVRIAALGGDAVALARAVAVLGEAVPLRRAAVLAGVDVGVASGAADGLAHVDVLAPGRPLTFLHPVVRSAVYGDIPPAERARMHREAAGLVHADAGAVDAAPHLVACEATGDPSVVGLLREAARDALTRGAADAAVSLLARARDEPPREEDRVDVAVELGGAAVIAGAHEVAVQALRPLLESDAPASTRAEVALLAVPAMAYGGRAAEADELCDRLADELRGVDDELSLKLDAHERFSRPDRVQAERLRRHQGLTGASQGQRLVLCRSAHCLALVGDLDAAGTIDLVDRALPGPDAIVIDSPLAGTCTFEALWALLLCDEPRRIDGLGTAMADAIRAGGYEYPFVFYLSWAAEVAWRQGKVAECGELALRGLDIAERYPFGVVPAHRALGFLVLARLERGDTAAARRAWDEIDVGPNFMGAYGDLRHVEAELRLAEGDRTAAIELLDAFGEDCESQGRHNPSYWPWRARLAELHAADGRADAARALVDTGLVRARRFGVPGPVAALLQAAAAVEDDGLPLLEEAVAVAAGSSARLQAARALAALGGAQRRANRRAQARDTLRSALDRAERCGATRLAEEVREELLTAGARPRRRQVSGVDALTASERRIARLAARGATNREAAQELYLSVRTVEMHLSNAYRKLGISSRAQLVEALGDVVDDGAAARRTEREAAAQAAPDGTVTILFSDVEGSATLIDELGDARWLEALRRHNACLRAVIASTGGHEVKTIGDAFMVAFADPRAALACAVGMQQRLARLNAGTDTPLRVRIGLHTGVAISEDEDYHGRAVVVASRVAAAARGGQVLCSDRTCTLAGDLGELRVTEAAPIRLKGLRAPEAVREVVW